jgi:hypothetical protein
MLIWFCYFPRYSSAFEGKGRAKKKSRTRDYYFIVTRD